MKITWKIFKNIYIFFYYIMYLNFLFYNFLNFLKCHITLFVLTLFLYQVENIEPEEYVNDIDVKPEIEEIEEESANGM